MLHELVYNSYASTRKVEEATLRAILASSRRNNARVQVTGLLLYHGGQYVQLLEGRREAVHHIFHLIMQDTRHRNLRICWETGIRQRNFADWRMGFARRADLDALPESPPEGYLAGGIASLDLSTPASVGRKLLLSIYESMATAAR